ncbi:MAG: hypothetical protein R3C11_02400 [Planctomycetaceae bacterium]
MRLKSIRNSLKTAPLMAGCLLLTVTAVWACSVPVFRYALEQWSSDQYEVLIFHQAPLDENSSALLKPYENSSKDEATTAIANLHVRYVDLNKELSEADQLVWQAQADEVKEELPRMVVRYPLQAAGFKGHPEYFDAWSASWSEENFNKLLDSPARREIARRLVSGETAIWVLLRSGNKELDDAAREAMTKGIAKANETLELPEIDEQDIKDGLVKIDPALLKVNFTSYEIDQNNPDEVAFISMLLGSEDDLYDLREEPMAFPIFGRGRVLYGLIGAGISEENMLISCTELIGPCTCQVKEENPGTDLVMNVDWDNLIESTIDLDKELPPLQGLASFSEPQAEGESEATPNDRERLAALQKAAGLEEETVPELQANSEDAEALASVTPGSTSPDKTTADKTPEVDQAASASEESSTSVEISEVTSPAPVKAENGFINSILGLIGLGVVLIAIGTFFIIRKTGTNA